MSKVLPVARRDSKRARVWLAGQISGSNWQEEAHIRDLSACGALVSCERVPTVDTIITLSCGSFEANARVAWVGNHFAGMQFLLPVDPQELIAQIGPALRVSAPRAYSGFEEDCLD